MIADIPTHYWLLVLVVLWLIPAAGYAVRYAAGGPADLAQRSRSRFVGSLALIATLIGLAIFILTPFAADLAYSPWFKPVMVTALAAFAGWTVARDLASGRAMLVSGVGPYARSLQPKRYWTAVMFGLAITIAVSWAAMMAWTGRI